jgi:hypothetical protein
MEQQLIQGLMARGFPRHIAVGMVANMRAESGLNPGINEIAPLVPGSRGGFGLYQVTGPRRRQYEAFAKQRGAALDDVGAQLDFLKWETENTERRSWSDVKRAGDATEAAKLISQRFLRPGIPNLANRVKFARQLDGSAPRNALGADFGGNALSQPGYAQQNALAMAAPPEPEQPRLQFQINPLDPAAFMMRG